MGRKQGAFYFVTLTALAVTVAFSCVAAAGNEGGSAVAETARLPAPVLTTPTVEQEKGVEPSAEVLRWRAEIMNKFNREPGPEQNRAAICDPAMEPSEFVPPSVSVQRDDVDASGKVSTDSVFHYVIKHGFTTTENPIVGNAADPSVAVSQMKKLWMTTNWSAARSTDHGRNWTYINPSTFFVPPDNMEFCCDQDVVFDRTFNFFIWSLLYVTDDEKGGCVRIACSKNLTMWWYYNLAYNTSMLPKYPRLGLTGNYVYVTYMLYSPTAGFVATHVTRLPLQQLVLKRPLLYQDISTTDSNLTIVNGLHSLGTMYAATNSLGNAVRVYEWKEGAASYSWHDIQIASWSSDSMVCACPDAHNPCGQKSTQFLAAAAANNPLFPETCKNQLWLFWNAKDIFHPYPYVYGVKICLDTWKRIKYAHIWNSNYAFQNPDLAPNSRGDFCFTVDVLGGVVYNARDNTIIDQYNGYNPTWTFYAAADGTACPDKWGNFNTTASWWRNGYQCVSIGHIRTSSHPQNWYTRFTRERDQ